MSSLLVLSIPGLLILATFGLERLETGLTGDAFTAADAAAELGDNTTPARAVSHEDPLPVAGGQPGERRWPADLDRPHLPTRVYVHHQPKTAFQPSGHADRV